VDFKRKLGHLRPPAPAEPARDETLAALRLQMASILGRPSTPKPRAPAEAALSELPFVRHETPDGPLHQRLQRHGAGYTVGRIPVDAALTARAEILALLALDPSLAEVEPRRVLFLDTETTGLAGSGTIAFVVGLAFFEGGELVVEQLFLRTPSEEAPLLSRIAERVAAASCLVTFNGKAFDLPTLQGRFVMNRLTALPERPHLDLLHVARRLHKARVGSCTLKAVEAEVLGFVRDADIDGGDVPARYTHYLRTGDEAAIVSVIDHNAWDVVSMAALLGLYGEPIGCLHGEDLVGLARTYRRARAFEHAELAAEAAIQAGAGPDAVRIRGEIAKARGDRARALADFEALALAVDDPSVRLELAKLYEHFVKQPERAIELLDRGTGERPEAAARRRARLEQKSRRSRDPI
jgi:uncharacterized protein YprB with RNaseH-like and TPR domain